MFEPLAVSALEEISSRSDNFYVNILCLSWKYLSRNVTFHLGKVWCFTLTKILFNIGENSVEVLENMFLQLFVKIFCHDTLWH